ncbi:MAG: hypothetical protein IJ329_00160 [Clostridia bacterium]|nr:hypothetical protein [Clostridia bacterium]
MKAKIKNIVVGGLSALMLAAIPFVAATVNKVDAPVTASAATSDIAAENNLALNKWDWEVDEIASGVTTFDSDSMYMDGISSVGGPFATYKTNRLDDFKYSMYANLSLTTAHEIDGVDSAKDWDYSTFYISFMINSETIAPVYARPWSGPAYFSVCFEKLYLEYDYCPTCERALETGACPVCGGTEYETNGRLMSVIRVYRNECFDSRGYDRVDIVEKTWYEGCENDVGKDFDYDGDIDEKDLQATDIGVNFADGNYHWFDFEVKNNASNNGITVNFYYDNTLMFTVDQANTFETTTSAGVDKTLTVDFANTTGWLGFWTDSSFPDLSADRTNCYVDIKQLGIAPITNGTVGDYYEKAPKPDLPITALTYGLNNDYPKGEEIEVPLSALFSYEGDEEITYEFVDVATMQALGEIRNGYWVWTPTTGDNVFVQVTATVQDGTNAKKATNYLDIYLSGEDIVATQLTAPTVTLNGNVASWTAVENAGGYKYKIGVNGTETTASENSVTLKHNETLYVKALAANMNYLDSTWSTSVTYTATTLATPEVKLSGTTANWAAIENAESYNYKIGESGEVQNTENTYVMGLTHQQQIFVQAVGNGTTTLDSEWTLPTTYLASALAAPVVKLNGNVASWNAISNASGYVYKIGANGEEQAASGTSVELTHGQTLYVKALGNNETNLDSKWSTAVSYTAPTLDTPYVERNGKTVSWEEVDGAEGYAYKINGGTEVQTDGTSVTLENGQSVQVKALGNGKTSLDSGWSTTVTYTAVTLATPEVTISNGVASWTALQGANGYVYKIGVNGTETSVSGTSVELQHNDTIYVKAIGDGVEYLDGGWSIPKTYNAGALDQPNVTLNGNVASWTAVDGASAYVCKLDDTEKEITDCSITLTHGQTLKVKAIGTGKEDSYWSNSVTYAASALPAPTVTIDGNTASWTAVDNASGYAYKIGVNGEEKTVSGTSVTLTHNQTLYVKALGDNETALDSAWSVAATYKAATLSTPVVALNGNTASWTAVDNASGYAYKIGVNGEEKTVSGTSVTLTHNQTVYVKALGDNETALDSAWSEAVTYKAATLSAPVVTLNGKTASWTAVANASGYVYKIGATGTEQTTTATSVTLTHNQTVYVKAIGDNETALSSVWSMAVTYKAAAVAAPTVTLDGNVASWEEVSGATGYVYTINGGETQVVNGTSVTLENGQTIQVKALGDGVDSADSSWSTAVTYTQESATPDDNPDDSQGVLDGIYTDSGEDAGGCGSVIGTFGITAMLLAAGIVLGLKRRGEEKQ